MAILCKHVEVSSACRSVFKEDQRQATSDGRSFSPPLKSLSTIFALIFNVYLFLRARERNSASGGGTEKEGDTESEAGSRLRRAVSTEPDAGLGPTNREIMT